jgi:hypothetical protein
MVPAMHHRLSRRALLKVLGAAAAFPLPACGSSNGSTDAPGALFTADERRDLGALANYVIPPEGTSPGGADLGAVPYIERLLTAFDVDPPAIFADGPFSGRKPLPNGFGASNDFARFIPLDRVTEKAWRIRIEGGGINDPIVPKLVGLRDQVKKAIADARAYGKAPLETLPADQLRDAFISIDTDLQATLIDLVTQAAFAAPEYGGNPNGAGWKLAYFEGDTMPTGLTKEEVELPGGPDPMPLDAGTHDILDQVVKFLGGKVFS